LDARTADVQICSVIPFDSRAPSVQRMRGLRTLPNLQSFFSPVLVSSSEI
jgi:hypothetical protein